MRGIEVNHGIERRSYASRITKAGVSQPFIAEPSMDRRATERARPAERHGGRESETLQDVEVERRASAK